MIYYKVLRRVAVSFSIAIFILLVILLFPLSTNLIGYLLTIICSFSVLFFIVMILVGIFESMLYNKNYRLFCETCNVDTFIQYLKKHQQMPNDTIHLMTTLNLSNFYMLKSDYKQAYQELKKCDNNASVLKYPSLKFAYHKNYLKLHLRYNQLGKANEHLQAMKEVLDSQINKTMLGTYQEQYKEMNYLIELANGISTDQIKAFYYDHLQNSKDQFNKIRFTFFLALAYRVNQETDKANEFFDYVLKNGSTLCYSSIIKSDFDLD